MHLTCEVRSIVFGSDLHKLFLQRAALCPTSVTGLPMNHIAFMVGAFTQVHFTREIADT